MKKFIVLILIALLPVVFMASCGSKSSPTSSDSNTATPTSTTVPNQVGPAALNMGTAASFAVLANSGITNNAESVCGNLGEYPGTSSTGTVAVYSCSGVSHIGDATAQAAMSSIFALNTGAYNVGLAMTGSTPIPGALGSGQSLAPGFYTPAAAGNSFSLSGTLTLDNTGGNPNNVYVFSTGSGSPGTVSTAANSNVVLINVLPRNVFWIAGTSITLGGASTFAGNLMANTTIQFGANTTLKGHAYANSAITFGANDVIANP